MTKYIDIVHVLLTFHYRVPSRKLFSLRRLKLKISCPGILESKFILPKSKIVAVISSGNPGNFKVNPGSR